MLPKMCIDFPGLITIPNYDVAHVGRFLGGLDRLLF